MRPIRILAAASGLGAPDQGCAEGPDALQASSILLELGKHGLDIAWHQTFRPDTTDKALSAIQRLNEQLAWGTTACITAGTLPLIMGGDHSCAVGTWSGAALALRPHGPLGLVWIDAHMDSHTPETTPSGAIHGMPLAALLGHGRPELVGIGGFSPKVLPRHLCLVGVRSYESGEAELLRRLGVRVFFMDEVKQRGIGAVIRDALAIARNGSAGYGISIDLDAFSPQESPGVGTPVQDGLHHLGLDRVLRGIANDPQLIALELAEYNPQRDLGGRTLKLIGDLLAALGRT